MNLLDLEKEIPNGFHDSQLKGIDIDYVTGRVRIHVDICVGDPEAEDWDGREKMRPAVVTLTGLSFLCIDPPFSGYPFEKRGSLRIDGGTGQPSTSEVTIPPLKEGATLYWFFVNEWNSFIRIAAEEALIKWQK
jgi:hypothetical protein